MYDFDRILPRGGTRPRDLGNGQRFAHRNLLIVNSVPSRLVVSAVTVRTAVFYRAAGLLVLMLLAPSLSFCDKSASTAMGFTIELPSPEVDVLSAVQTVVEDHIIRGTYVYEREKTLNEAVSEKSSAYFRSGDAAGHVFYKVRRDALAPRNFKNSSDVGVITVRYLVRGTSDNTTHLEILAVFVEDGTNRVHESNSAVETAEFAEIQKQLLSIQKDRQMAAEAGERKNRQAEDAAALATQRAAEMAREQAADSSLESLKRRVNELQHTLEVRIPNPSTELKSAPFRGAASLMKVQANTDVLVEIITTYWLGVETPDGHRGWVPRDQVIPLP